MRSLSHYQILSYLNQVNYKNKNMLIKFICLKNSLEVDGRGLSPYSQVPTHDPTQRLRGNPITLNRFLYCKINI